MPSVKAYTWYSDESGLIEIAIRHSRKNDSISHAQSIRHSRENGSVMLAKTSFPRYRHFHETVIPTKVGNGEKVIPTTFQHKV